MMDVQLGHNTFGDGYGLIPTGAVWRAAGWLRAGLRPKTAVSRRAMIAQTFDPAPASGDIVVGVGHYSLMGPSTSVVIGVCCHLNFDN